MRSLELEQLALRELMVSILLNKTIKSVSCIGELEEIIKFRKFHYYENVMKLLFNKTYYNIKINKQNKEYNYTKV